MVGINIVLSERGPVLAGRPPLLWNWGLPEGSGGLPRAAKADQEGPDFRKLVLLLLKCSLGERSRYNVTLCPGGFTDPFSPCAHPLPRFQEDTNHTVMNKKKGDRWVDRWVGGNL